MSIPKAVVGNTIATGDAAGAPAGSAASNATNLGGLFQGQGLEGFLNFLGSGGGMGSAASSLTGGKDGSSSSSSDGSTSTLPLDVNLSGVAQGETGLATSQEGLAGALEGLAGQDMGISEEAQNLSGLETGYGTSILGPAYSQYTAGATGSESSISGAERCG